MLGATSVTLCSVTLSLSWTTGRVTVTRHTEEGGEEGGEEGEGEEEGDFKVDIVMYIAPLPIHD